jgi:hypothetical protein
LPGGGATTTTTAQGGGRESQRASERVPARAQETDNNPHELCKSFRKNFTKNYSPRAPPHVTHPQPPPPHHGKDGRTLLRIDLGPYINESSNMGTPSAPQQKKNRDFWEEKSRPQQRALYLASSPSAAGGAFFLASSASRSFLLAVQRRGKDSQTSVP